MLSQKLSSWFWPLVVVAPILLAAIVVMATPSRQTPSGLQNRPRYLISPNDQFFGVTVSADGRGFVVGSRGLLLESSASARSWSRRVLKEARSPEGEPISLYSVAFAPDGKTGWITGEMGLILHTTDGGETWARQDSTVDSRLFKIAVISAQDVCVVGDSTLLWTDDGGAHWQKGKTPRPLPPLMLNSVVFPDSRNGWVVGEFVTILHTADGGRTWEIQSGGEIGQFDTLPFFAAVFKNDREGIVYSQDGITESTTDGGKTWKKGSLNPKFSVFAAALANGKIYLAGARGMLMRCTENGECTPESPVPRDLAGLSFGHDLGLAVGLGGTVLETRDGVKWSSIVGREVD